MKIFLKYIIKSMTEKKARFILLITAIALSTGLLIASMGTIDIALDALLKPAKESLENKEIIINANNKDRFFDADNINESGIKNITKSLQLNGSNSVEDEDDLASININGRKTDDIKQEDLIEGSLDDFNEKKCIISKRISEDKNLKIGDDLNIIMAGEKVTLKVEGISKNNGLFYTDNSSDFAIIIPYSYMAKDLNAEGKFNFITAEKDGDSLNDSIDKFNDNNSDFEAKKLLDEDKIKSQASSFNTIFYYMLVIVVLMSSIIIYSSFKLIITERMSVIGTFLSQGARKITIEKILYLESVFYGIIGAFLGSFIGIGGLNIINKLVSPLAKYGIYEDVIINPSYIIYASIFAIVLSFLSALLPIRKIRKLQVKDVILNSLNETIEIKWSKFVLGLVFLGICLAASYYNSDFINLLSPLFIILTFIGVILIYPKLVDIISSIIYKIFRGKSKTLLLAVNNLKTSKVLLGNISLILISIMSVFMISSLGSSIEKYVTGVYENLDFDIDIDGISTVRSGEESAYNKILTSLKDKDGFIEDSVNPLSWNRGSFKGNEITFSTIAMESEKFMNYCSYLQLDKEPAKSEYEPLLNKEDGIVITSILSKKTGLKKGDTCTLSIQDIQKDVKILGVIDGKLLNNGYFILLNHDYFEKTWGISGYSQLTFKTSIDQKEFKDNIKSLRKDYGIYINTRDEELQKNNENNAMIINILNIFAYMSMIIAALGIVSNIFIGFIQRKRSLAVLSSIGMSKKNRGVMLVFESIFTVIWATLISIPGTIIVVKLLTKIINTMDLTINVTVDYNQIPMYFISALIIVLIATIPVLFKSRKLSVVNELKYE